MPFPTEFDDYFIIALALRLAPRHSARLGPDSVAMLERARSQIRARYRKPRPVQDMPRGLLGQSRSAFGLTQADFNAGRTWR
jgi:hypothetical protein